jgi:GNAT superfamily N-acetyltransferase
MAEDLLIQHIFPLSAERVRLIETLYDEFVSEGLYSVEEIDGMRDPHQHDVSWLPKGSFVWVASLGGFVGGTLVGCVDALQRVDEIVVVEQLAVHPQHRGHGYARRLVREAVASARRARLSTLEVFALEREAKAVKFWRHLVRAAPNMDGHMMLLGTRRPAKGWRLPTAEISV